MNEFLRELLKSRAAEAALLHLFHYGETYGRAIAKDMGVSQMPVQTQLDRLEACGLLVSKQMGKTRNYQWNTASPFLQPVKEMVGLVYESISPADRAALFATRRRPRRKDKPVIGEAARPDAVPDLVVLAHFAFFYGDFTERCFVKIANASSSRPVLVTHIDYVGSAVRPLLDSRLPHKLSGAGQMEVHVPVAELPDGKTEEMLTRFRVTDSLGRKFWSAPNADVSPAGMVASPNGI